MKRLIKAVAATAVSLMAVQASAIQVTYTFRVNSSGPSMYPCNAGLTTENPYEGDKAICYTADTHEACTQDCVGLDCSGGQEGPTPHGHDDDHGPGPKPDGHHGPGPQFVSSLFGQEHHQPPKKNACVCTTESGRRKGNYFHANYTTWGENKDPHSDVVSGESPYFNELFNEKDAYKFVLQKLAFNLGSELYTAKYFVDICYRGSQIDYSHFDTKWNLLAEASVTDYGFGTKQGQGNQGYSELADLKMKAFLICTTQNKSCDQGNCDDKDSNLSGYEVARFNDEFLKGLGQGNFNYSKVSGWEDATSSSFLPLIEKYHEDLGDKKATKFCKVRYVFSETNGKHPKYAKHRKWQKHGADICTHTKIEMSKLQGDKDCRDCGHNND